MNSRCMTLAGMLLAGTARLALAQSAPDLEPGVQTSPASTAVPAGAATTASAPGSAPTPASEPSGRTASRPKPAAAASQATPTPPAGLKSQDKIQLDTTQISGNRELPKVMYVVPWRRADPGEFAGRPPNSLLDEALTPVDRDVFRRQNRYYATLEGPGGSPGAATSQSAGDGSASKAPDTRDEK
jgi:hypothetical protein